MGGNEIFGKMTKFYADVLAPQVAKIKAKNANIGESDSLKVRKVGNKELIRKFMVEDV
jgi:hypothetical protein